MGVVVVIVLVVVAVIALSPGDPAPPHGDALGGEIQPFERLPPTPPAARIAAAPTPPPAPPPSWPENAEYRRARERQEAIEAAQKEATALKKSGRARQAIDVLERTIAEHGVTSWDFSFLKKVFSYKLRFGERQEAVEFAERCIANTGEDVIGMYQALSMRSETLLKLGRFVDSFLDEAGAAWCWRDAMKHQKRLNEFPKRKAVSGLVESAKGMGVVKRVGPRREALSAAVDAASLQECLQIVRAAVAPAPPDGDEASPPR